MERNSTKTPELFNEDDYEYEHYNDVDVDIEYLKKIDNIIEKLWLYIPPVLFIIGNIGNVLSIKVLTR